MTGTSSVADRLPLVAASVVNPVWLAVKLPVESTLPTKGLLIVHVDWLETSLVVLSVNVRSAENFFAPPPAIIAPCGGAMTKPFTTAGPTVNDNCPLTVPEAAETVTVPCFSVCTSPVAFTVAIVISELDQTTLVRVCEVPSEKAPVAVNWSVSPAATVLL